jgi:hypothetical protein
VRQRICRTTFGNLVIRVYVLCQAAQKAVERTAFLPSRSLSLT